MGTLEIILMAVALAMDCFAVATVSGVLMSRYDWKTILRFSLLFGIFQGGMPLIGWQVTELFASQIEAIDHWIAFLMLLFIGCRMIKDAFADDMVSAFNPASLTTELLFAVATSIDALAVGVTFSCTGYRTLSSLVVPTAVITLASFVFGVAGHVLGITFGRTIGKRLKPELIGGIILILIGLNILYSHLTA